MPRAPRFTYTRALHHVTLYRSTIIEQSSYFLRCMAYVDLNPVRAGLAATPRDYRWSGHGALSVEDASVLDIHDLYLELGRDAEARYRAYEGLVAAEEASRPAFSLAWVHSVGRARFLRRMEARFGVEAAERGLRRGRRPIGSWPCRTAGSRAAPR